MAILVAMAVFLAGYEALGRVPFRRLGMALWIGSSSYGEYRCLETWDTGLVVFIPQSAWLHGTGRL